MIDICLAATPIMAGKPLSGSLIWQTPHGQIPKKATISVYWYTEGRGTRNRQTVQTLMFEAAQLAAGSPMPFALTLPSEGPISYDGALFRLMWELTVCINMPGLLGAGYKRTWPIMVRPRQTS